MHEFCAILSGILIWVLMFAPMFNDSDGFWECVCFWFTPDAYSFDRGEWTEDWWAELKLGFWFISGIFAGFVSWMIYRPWISEALLIGVLALMVLPKLPKKKALLQRRHLLQGRQTNRPDATRRNPGPRLLKNHRVRIQFPRAQRPTYTRKVN